MCLPFNYLHILVFNSYNNFYAVLLLIKYNPFYQEIPRYVQKW